ncbi:glutathione peroxidase [Paenibacillus sp. MMS18-CY102]|uniref:glutathione peroxidase n=1 Tax=Paenibacillus sp. MMS18-CY102 TaxID=2682849 RepID=UPI001365F38C|nr:glutathione peroxidase [Paenibacillus sp. MMS18-CY102]MWC27357.1 redoxin domain-containing protein [Paenibacillus sp. MMS18-CY102]
MSVYDFTVNNVKGEPVSLSAYKGKVLVIVNTASKCGLTPQYEGLQALYEKYQSQGLEILGFPCNQFNEQEPGSNKEVEAFCKLNYGVKFPLFEKSDVRGETAIPLFKYLSAEAPFEGESDSAEVDNDPKWNFTKFIVSRDGQVVDRFEPREEPSVMEATLAEMLK